MPHNDVKYCATATGTTVAKPASDSEALLAGKAKNSAVSVVVPTVANSVDDAEARPPEFEKHSTTSPLVELGHNGPEHRAHPVLGLQQPQGLLAKLSLLESKSRVPRQTPISLCPLVKLGLLGPKQMAGTVLPPQQP